MSQAEASLKLVALGAESEAVVASVGRELHGLAGDDELRVIGESAFVIHTPLTVADLRDRLQAKVVGDGDSLIVVEFETWSGYGPEIDSAWLMRRGH